MISFLTHTLLSDDPDFLEMQLCFPVSAAAHCKVKIYMILNKES